MILIDMSQILNVYKIKIRFNQKIKLFYIEKIRLTFKNLIKIPL